MKNKLKRWVGSFLRDRRYAARQADAKLLWPAIWEQSGGDPNRFIQAATLHTAADPNWRGHEVEWQLTPVEPGTWVAIQLARKQTS